MSVIGTAPTAMGTIRDRVTVTPSRHIPGIDVICVPGLSYYATVEAAEEAVRLLRVGQYPLVHGPVRRSGDL